VPVVSQGQVGELGRFANNERWTLAGKVVKTIKYVGVYLSSNTSMENHFQQKRKVVRLAINSTWNTLLGTKNINCSSKYKIFQAAKTITCYAAQVWDHTPYDEVKRSVTYFIKSI